MSQWPEGPYKGNLASWKISTSAKKGTPGFVLTFDIEGHSKDVTLWLSEGAIENTEKKLVSLGWNLDYEKPDFANRTGIDLSLKYEDYKGKPQERWDIRFSGAPAPPTLLQQLSVRARAVHGPPRTAPPGRPAPVPFTSPPLSPPKPDTTAATTKESAWAHWCSQPSGPDPERWQIAVNEVGPDEDKFTPEQWRKVASKAIPF